MLRNGSCSRALSLAARLCCNDSGAWHQDTLVAAHLLQYPRAWSDIAQSAGASMLLQYLSSSGHPLHMPTWHQTWPSAWNGNSLGIRCLHTSSSSHSDQSSTGESLQNAAAARPRDLALVFTCAKCDTRAVKTFTKQAYEHGLVLITCPGCKSMHLIADHLGWFGDSGFKIDEYLAAHGQQVKRINMDQLDDGAAQVTPEDMAGWSKVQQLLSTVAGAAANSTQPESDTGCCGGQHHEGTAQPSEAIQGSTTAAGGTGGDASCESSDAPRTSEGQADGDMGSNMLQEANSGVVEVAPSDVAAWVRVQQQKHQNEGAA